MADMDTSEDGTPEPKGRNDAARTTLPLRFVPPRVTTYRAEDLDNKDLIINAGSDDPYGDLIVGLLERDEYRLIGTSEEEVGNLRFEIVVDDGPVQDGPGVV